MSINAIETLQFNCTTCPSECLLTVEVERDADGAVVEVQMCIRDRASRSQLGAVAKVQVFVVGHGDVSARAAIYAIWENGLDLFV